MTIGIYALYWECSDSIYIGQSKNIEYRYTEHIRGLNTNKHYNHKVQTEFNKYGIPELNILVQNIDVEQLDNLEIALIREFDNTLNITLGGNGVRGISGELHHNSKYSNNIIEDIFIKYLANRILTYKEISALCNIPDHILEQIGSGYHHTWLKDKYPKEYNDMLKSKEIKLLGPFGQVSTTDIQKICKEYNLDPSTMYKVIAGKRKSHKGWSKI